MLVIHFVDLHALFLHNAQEMERLQAKGELAEPELRALEMDVTGKVQHPVSLPSHYHSDIGG